jgi:hypothetical protein
MANTREPVQGSFLRTFIQSSALFLTLAAAVFLAKGNLQLSAPAIVSLAGTAIGYNSNVVKAFATQHADTWVGVVLLLLATAFQTSNALWNLRYKDMATHKAGFVAGIALSLVSFAMGLCLSNAVAKATLRQALELLAPYR